MKNEQFHLEQYFQSNWLHFGQEYQYLFSFFPNNTTQRFGICDYIHFNLIETLNKIKFNWIKILELFWKYFKEENQISMLWQETKGRWRLLVEGTAWNVDSNFNT